jgi:hypothetical protein
MGGGRSYRARQLNFRAGRWRNWQRRSLLSFWFRVRVPGGPPPLLSRTDAGVAELEDAPGLGPGERKLLEVRVLSPALYRNPSAARDCDPSPVIGAACVICSLLPKLLPRTHDAAYRVGTVHVVPPSVAWFGSSLSRALTAARVGDPQPRRPTMAQ